MSVVPCLWLLEIYRFNSVMNQAINAGVCNTSMRSHQESAAILGQIFDQTDQTGISNNRSRRHALSTDLQQRVGLFNSPCLSEKYAKRLKRLKRANRKGREMRRRKTNTTSVPTKVQEKGAGKATTSAHLGDFGVLSTTDINVENSLTSNDFSTNESESQNTAFSVTTESSMLLAKLDQSTMTKITMSNDDEGINLSNLGDKLNKQISNLRLETEHIWSKTKEAISKLVSSKTRYAQRS